MTSCPSRSPRCSASTSEEHRPTTMKSGTAAAATPTVMIHVGAPVAVHSAESGSRSPSARMPAAAPEDQASTRTWRRTAGSAGLSMT